ncbi:MBL fold metallo-hydrolase [Streptomyces sp. ME19-01-6]|uniref:MBL fold metallo-hydrolase n=1 Tax=Streptomyces sp. ME19-01-6 TaxID=3028686 RepID=UPI0029A9EB1F|nr:MBL fold metallo-hydrolase [Streptomyces sp. ME19-01-6]MDX3224826.1 MBL fold metallo-hydrolase [Streptomyces sp. ME19-01-6]
MTGAGAAREAGAAGASGVTDHGGGVWSIPVPIPDNPLGHTLVHLLDTDRGPVLIDTGWDDPTSWDTLTAGLAACGTSVSDVHGVLVTHHHPDHHGLSAQVREASGAWIAMHEADAEVVRRTREAEPTRWLDYLAVKLTAAGAPKEHLAPLREARASGHTGTLPGSRAAQPDRHITPGELLDLPGRRLRAIWTPGHTPGHVCLHLEEAHPAAAEGMPGHGRLFSGDHLLPEISPHIGLYEDPDDATVTDPLGDYVDSLERVAALDPAEVLPAHQHAFTDAPGRVRALLRHHEERLAGLRALLLGAPLTPWQLAEAMEWNRPWADIPYGSRNIAVSEAEAHLRRLVKQGRAEPVPGTDPAAYRAV